MDKDIGYGPIEYNIRLVEHLSMDFVHQNIDYGPMYKFSHSDICKRSTRLKNNVLGTGTK